MSSKGKGKPQAIKRNQIESICNLIRCGNYVKTSVLANGVNYHTYLDYMRKGKAGVSPYDEYYRMQEQAKAEAEIAMSGRLDESARAGNVGADMFKLQRMYPQRWGATKRVEAKVDNTQRIEIVRHSDVGDTE